MTEQSETPAGFAFTIGDEITIMRGLHRGSTGKIVAVDTANSQYAVQLTDGTVAVVNVVNVRKPDEATISASELAKIVHGAGSELDSVVADLVRSVPGFGKAYDSL